MTDVAPIPELEESNLELEPEELNYDNSILAKVETNNELTILSSIIHPHESSYLYIIQKILEKKEKEEINKVQFIVCEYYEDEEGFKVMQMPFPEGIEYDQVLGFIFNYIFRVITDDEEEKEEINK